MNINIDVILQCLSVLNKWPFAQIFTSENITYNVVNGTDAREN